MEIEITNRQTAAISKLLYFFTPLHRAVHPVFSVPLFICRIPSEIWTTVIDQELYHATSELTWKKLIYVWANSPLFLCSAINPWMYAYHNLDLKPLMRRILRRIFKPCLRVNNNSLTNGLYGGGEDETVQPSQYEATRGRSGSVLTQWQISVFATFSR